MKKLLAILLCAMLLMPACPRAALGDTARDITTQCKITSSDSDSSIKSLYDRDETTGCGLRAGRGQYLQITPGDAPVAAVMLEFGTYTHSFAIQAQDADGAWREIASFENTGDYGQAYLTFPAQSGRFRIAFSCADGRERKATIREMYLFSEGTPDLALAHAWQPPCEKADLLFVVAHPDDEILWFGGAIPYYAGQLGLQVQAAYLTCYKPERRLELLNGLWHCGVRSYPDIADFEDYNYQRVDYAYRAWGKENILSHLVRLLRRYQPEAVVTHDLKGEYGHTQHIVCSETVLEAASRAADASYDPDSARQYGVWQVKKVYRHLGDAPTTRMDWSQPLSFFNGRTGLEGAAEAFQLHVTQTWSGKFAVAAPGDSYDSTVYTLAYSTVGEDARGGDFLENIPLESLSNYIPEATNP